MDSGSGLDRRESKTATDPRSSFRDPAGRLFEVQGRILRAINSAGAQDFTAFIASTSARKFTDAGQLVRTEALSRRNALDIVTKACQNAALDESDVALFVEHEKIPFSAFPYEWSPSMLHKAGCLTLDFAEELLTDGFGLKDATPYNILFRGPEPVFIDLLSFETRDRGDPTWLPYAQFVRTFLLPLLVNKHFAIPLEQIFTGRRDGLEPHEVYRYCRPFQKLRPPFLTLASIPTWLTSRQDHVGSRIYQKQSLANTEKARFILTSVLKRLRRVLNKLAPNPVRKSSWTNYMGSDCSYSQEHFVAKHRFIEHAMAEFRPTCVLDVGCNTGHFSAVAAAARARVIAIDSDPEVVEETYRNALLAHHDILPLVVNLTRPTPALGWRNRECPSFLDRARGAFDAVLMLAVVHHMLITERIPLPEIIDLAADLTTDLLLIEFIAPDDSMFRRLTRGRDALFTSLTLRHFEATCQRHFEIVRSQHLDYTSRWLFLLRKKTNS